MFGCLWNLVPRAWQAKLVYWLEENRGLVVLFFCLPASLLFDWMLRFRSGLQRLLAPRKGHDDLVRAIQEQVRTYHQQESTKPATERRLLCSARPNWLSLSLSFYPKHLCNQVPLPLFEILGLDEERRVIRVEPMVTVGQATDYLMQRNYALQVCLEIAEATLGGLAMGVGMTTHSHKAGLFQESVVAYDVVLANGDLVHVTADNEYSDLFYTLPWSHGSLAFLVALELRVIPAQPYILLSYESFSGSQKAYCDRLREVSGATKPNGDKPLADFVEATVFSRTDAVIMQGSFASSEEVRQGRHPVNALARWYKPWFYKHVQSIFDRNASKKTTYKEYVPLRDYLLRHNRSIFWVLEAMLPFGNEPWFRYTLGWLCPPRVAFLKFTTTPGVRALTFVKQVFQDIVLPMTEVEKAIDVSEELFDTYPILIYPCRIYNHGEQHRGQLRPPRSDQYCPDMNWGMFFDLGVYGVPGPVRRREPYDPVHTYRSIEKFTRDVGGYPFLYADLFLTRKEFEETFDLTAYNEVRRKYGAEHAFPHVYDKVKPEVDVVALGSQYAKESGAIKDEEKKVV